MEQERILHMALLAGVPVVEYHNEGGVPLLALRRFADLLVEAARADQEESLLVYSLSLSSRVKVENELWQISIEAEPLPDRLKCREFAKLIVQECMDIARNVGTISEPEDFALDRCYEIEQRIQDRFGVE